MGTFGSNGKSVAYVVAAATVFAQMTSTMAVAFVAGSIKSRDTRKRLFQVYGTFEESHQLKIN